jgi:hypothetical protein
VKPNLPVSRAIIEMPPLTVTHSVTDPAMQISLIVLARDYFSEDAISYAELTRLKEKHTASPQNK